MRRQWMHRPARHSVKRLGEPRATPELAIDQNLPDSDSIGLCVAQEREQASIPQLEIPVSGNPLPVGGLEHHRRGTTCERY